MDELKTLADKVSVRIGCTKLITLDFTPRKLALNLDLKKGFEGHEDVILIQRADLFDVKYYCYFAEAFRTFLNSRYLLRINESSVLSGFKDKVAQMKLGGRVEVYDKTIQEFYSQLPTFTEVAHSYEEAEKSALFFADVFSEKARGL